MSANRTPRINDVLAAMRRDAKVLERRGDERSYSLMWPDRVTYAGERLATPEVVKLYDLLDAYDATTGEALERASAYGSRKLVWRLKPDAVLS